MFKAMIKKIFILLVVLILSKFAYNQSVDTLKIHELKEAVLAFESERYDLAYPYFEKMRATYSKEPL